MRRGFTLMEVVVASAILVILAAVTIPQVLDALDKKRIEDTYDILQEVHYSITNSQNTGFMNVVRTGASANSSTAPGRLTELSEPISQNNVNYVNSCGGTATFNTTAATTWATGGPFLDRVVSATDGLRLPIGQMINTIQRNVNAPSTTAAFLKLAIANVDPNDAAALDARVDGVPGTANGAIQYGLPSTTNAPVTVFYLIPVPNRC
jgi:prepilin-type N-terminal cleavage/methylation domain-containing protein